MPDEYKDTKISIYCNDCGVTSEIAFHIYCKCDQEQGGCGGYNTRRA